MNISETDLFISKLLFGLAILAFVGLVIWEKKYPYRQFKLDDLKSSYLTNLSAFVFNNVVLTIVRATSLFFVAQRFASVGLLSSMNASNPIKWILAFLLYDLAIYGWHVWSHKNEFLWRFHKIHHSDKGFNTSTGFRFHVFDLILEIIYKCIFVVLIGVDASMVLAIESFQLFFIFFHHSNISFSCEKKLSEFIITPYLHRTHHSTKRSEHDSNYGIVLAVWDKLFDTRKELVPVNIGLDIIIADNLYQLFFLAFVTEKKINKILRLIPRGPKKFKR
jgi:sterol desaturase/sphingolipid hydroxylase (fatty acid hydroxylase superfamily)